MHTDTPDIDSQATEPPTLTWDDVPIRVIPALRHAIEIAAEHSGSAYAGRLASDSRTDYFDVVEVLLHLQARGVCAVYRDWHGFALDGGAEVRVANRTYIEGQPEEMLLCISVSSVVHAEFARGVRFVAPTR